MQSPLLKGIAESKRRWIIKNMNRGSYAEVGSNTQNVSIKAIQIHNILEKNRIKRYNFLGQNFFQRWSDRKNQTKIFLHRWSDKIGSNLWIPLIKRHKFLDKMFFPAMKRYNIPRYSSFTDEATQLPSILENVSITVILKILSIKATEFSSQFGGKIGATEEKSLAP
jgi:hypothetical protein